MTEGVMGPAVSVQQYNWNSYYFFASALLTFFFLVLLFLMTLEMSFS